MDREFQFINWIAIIFCSLATIISLAIIVINKIKRRPTGSDLIGQLCLILAVLIGAVSANFDKPRWIRVSL